VSLRANAFLTGLQGEQLATGREQVFSYWHDALAIPPQTDEEKARQQELLDEISLAGSQLMFHTVKNRLVRA